MRFSLGKEFARVSVMAITEGKQESVSEAGENFYVGEIDSNEVLGTSQSRAVFEWLVPLDDLSDGFRVF